MGYIFVDRGEGEGGGIRHQMRRSMRGGYNHELGYSPMMREHGGGYEHGYRMGYKHGWEDHEDDMEEENYRRARDSRGRFI